MVVRLQDRAAEMLPRSRRTRHTLALLAAIGVGLVLPLVAGSVIMVAAAIALRGAPTWFRWLTVGIAGFILLMLVLGYPAQPLYQNSEIPAL
jgi:hypothetical protein